MRDLASSSLPQRFGWVRSPQDADKALSILATAALDVASAAADGWIIGEAIGGIGELLGALLDGW
jgi:hypothetical protein